MRSDEMVIKMIRVLALVAELTSVLHGHVSPIHESHKPTIIRVRPNIANQEEPEHGSHHHRLRYRRHLRPERRHHHAREPLPDAAARSRAAPRNLGIRRRAMDPNNAYVISGPFRYAGTGRNARLRYHICRRYNGVNWASAATCFSLSSAQRQARAIRTRDVRRGDAERASWPIIVEARHV